MSASLVGSEMCIRDRPTTFGSCDGWRRTLSALRISGGAGGAPAMVHNADDADPKTALPLYCELFGGFAWLYAGSGALRQF
eukprot:5386408-Alexandrium_andersonii.AAC.1